MRLSKKCQIGLLFCLYLVRAGRATVGHAALNLNVPVPFLTQIAGILKRRGVLLAVRGPGGGYVLNGDVTIARVLASLDYTGFLNGEDVMRYSRGSAEHRAMANFFHQSNKQVNRIFKTSLRDITMQLAEIEKAIMDSATDEMGAV